MLILVILLACHVMGLMKINAQLAINFKISIQVLEHVLVLWHPMYFIKDNAYSHALLVMVGMDRSVLK